MVSTILRSPRLVGFLYLCHVFLALSGATTHADHDPQRCQSSSQIQMVTDPENISLDYTSVIIRFANQSVYRQAFDRIVEQLSWAKLFCDAKTWSYMPTETGSQKYHALMVSGLTENEKSQAAHIVQGVAEQLLLNGSIGSVNQIKVDIPVRGD